MFRKICLLIPLLVCWTAHASPPGDNLVIEEIPDVPPELAAQVARYENSRAVYLRDWHPQRREMLVGTRFAETYQLHRVAAPEGSRRQLTFFEEPVSCASYAGDGNRIVLKRDVGGNEAYQLFRLDLGDGGVTLLTDGTSRHSCATFDHAGDRIAYTSTQRNGKDHDIYVMDPADPAGAKRLLEVEGSWGVVDWSPDDGRLLLYRYVSVNHSELHVLDLVSGEFIDVAPRKRREPVFAMSTGHWAPDGESLYVVTDRGSEFRRFGTLVPGKGKFTQLSVDVPWDVVDVDISDDGKLAAYVILEEGRGILHLMDLEQRAELAAPALPAGQVGGLLFRPGSHELALWQSTDRTPGDVYSYDVDGGMLERWTASEVGGLNLDVFPVTEVTHYPTFDAVDGEPRQVPLLVTRPDAQRFPGPRPVLIRIHGGPEGQATPRFLGSRAYLVNELGVCYLQPNVRGSTGYGKEYRNLDNGALREDSVKDISALLDWVEQQPDLDASRIGVYGGSYGGYMVLASLIAEPERIRCGIDVVGISNFVTFLENTKDYRRDLRRVEYGDERDPAMREHLLAISPTTRAGEIRVPLLVAQGANDPRVPASEAEQIVEAARGGGQPVWYLLAKDEGHGFRKKGNRDYFNHVMILFLEQHLLGELAEQPAPEG